MNDFIQKIIGNQVRPVVSAEIGINHNGNLNEAKQLILSAKHSGADVVKFQNYHTEDFIRTRREKLKYKYKSNYITKSQYDLFKQCELSDENIIELKNLSDSLGITFQSTPTSINGLNLLVEIGCQSVKNGSDFLNNDMLLNAMAESNLTTVISTGMATFREIENALKIFDKCGNNKIVLLHCTSLYPAPPESLNLARIKTMKNEFGVPVGFSDHSIGNTASILATQLGASWIEKHFTIDKNQEGPDHQHSCDPEELKDLVDSVKWIRPMLGSAKIEINAHEQEPRMNYRLSYAFSKDMTKGEMIKETDVYLTRPGFGYAPNKLDQLLGKTLRSNVSFGNIVRQEDLNEES